MNRVKRNNARLGGPIALLLFASLLAGCETGPPELADEPPIADADAKPIAEADVTPTAALRPVDLHPAPTKLPRLLNASVEMSSLQAPAMQHAVDIMPRPREPDTASAPTSDAASHSDSPTAKATPAPKKTAMLLPDRPFEWPIEGKLVSGFGSGGDGARNDGINIAAAPGTPIHAAAAGTVTYAARLKGYGNLVLIRHDNGYITAYAHAQSLLVAPGDRVDRGDVIGLSGKSGDVATPQLHFEIREGTKAIDPRPLLLSSRES
jgi:murein DD-endopeptidase MepM/ murein hydrolase activator NlpD